MSELKISRHFIARTLGVILLSGFILLPLAGCDLAKNDLKMDRSSDLEFQDYRDAMAQRLPEAHPANEDDGTIPDLKSYMATPSDKLKPMPLVSVSVNESVPLKDVLYEMADQAGYDMQLDPRITGSIIFVAKNRPFDEAIDRLAKSAGLRYKFDGDSVRVELDTPYHKIYKINYLNYIRKNASSINTDVSVVSGEGTDTGSNFKAEATSEADFWTEITTNLTQIVGTNVNTSALRSAKTPKISAVSETPAPVEPVLLSANGEMSGGQGGKSGTSPTVQPPEAVLRVEPLPVEDGAEGEDGDKLSSEDARFSVNKSAGVISVYAPERVQTEVANYLEIVRKSVTSQVLIEAKVLEVGLADEYSAGIDWSAVDLFSGELNFGTNATGDAVETVATLAPPLVPEADPLTSFVASYTGNDFNLAIQAMQRFGTVRALASPRLTVMNNQSAVLNVAKNQVYFEIDADKEEATADNPVPDITFNTDIKTVPEGVLINVQPSIDLDNNTISMSIRPTVTRILEYVVDPTLAVILEGTAASDIQNRVPVVNVQEFDSVLQVNNGQAVVMGGLIQDRTDSVQNGVPVMSEIPLVGNLFKSHTDKVQKTELVVFLKATIVEGSNTIHDTDKDLYRSFSQDRRPFDL